MDADFGELLDDATIEEVAEAWHRYTATPEPDDDHPDWWAIEVLMDSAVYRHPDLIRALLLKLVELAPDEHNLGCVGAGPLENFLSDDEDDLRWIEAECAHNEGLRQALSGVWVDGAVTDETLRRLDAAAGTTLPRRRPREEWPPELIASEQAALAFDEVRSRIPEDQWETSIEVLAAEVEVMRTFGALIARDRPDGLPPSDLVAAIDTIDAYLATRSGDSADGVPLDERVRPFSRAAVLALASAMVTLEPPHPN